MESLQDSLNRYLSEAAQKVSLKDFKQYINDFDDNPNNWERSEEIENIVYYVIKTLRNIDNIEITGINFSTIKDSGEWHRAGKKFVLDNISKLSKNALNSFLRDSDIYFFIQKYKINKDKVSKNVTPKITINDYIGTKKRINVGSGTHIPEYGKTWTKETFIEILKSALKSNLYDGDFALNYTSNQKEYEKAFEKTLDKLVTNIDKTLSEYFTINRTLDALEMLHYDLKLRKYVNYRPYIDKWFKENKDVSEKTRKEYFDYRKEQESI